MQWEEQVAAWLLGCLAAEPESFADFSKLHPNEQQKLKHAHCYNTQVLHRCSRESTTVKNTEICPGLTRRDARWFSVLFIRNMQKDKPAWVRLRRSFFTDLAFERKSTGRLVLFCTSDRKILAVEFPGQ